MNLAPDRLLAGFDPQVGARGFHFDPEAAESVVRWFPSTLHLVMGTGAGEPYVLDDWAAELTRQIWGWYRDDNPAERRFTRVFLGIARKQAKTTYAAGSAMFALGWSPVSGTPRGIISASERGQAGRTVRICQGMIEADRYLSSRFKVGRRNVVDQERGGILEVISSDGGAAHGDNPSFTFVDELHAHKSRAAWDAVSSAQGARDERLMVIASTAGIYDSESPCWILWEYARRVKEDPRIDPRFLPILFEAPPDCDLDDLDAWQMAMPSLGLTVSESFIEEQLAFARYSAAEEAKFRRLYLNQWVKDETTWIAPHVWAKCDGWPTADELRAAPCYAGVDLSSTTDTTSIARVWPLADGRVAIDIDVWVPDHDLATRVTRDRAPFDQWAADGDVHLVPGETIEYERVYQRLIEYHADHGLVEVAIDPCMGAHLFELLDRAGIVAIKTPCQPSTMHAPTSRFESLALDGKILHGGRPVLAWMVGNVSIKLMGEGELSFPSKRRSAGRIDGAIAVLLGLSRAMLRMKHRESVYESRGVISI